MRRSVSGLVLVLVGLAVLLSAAPGAASAHGRRWHHRHHHHHHGWWGPRVVVGVVPPYGYAWGWGWRGYYGPPPYPYPYPYPEPVVVHEEPEVYIERPSSPGEEYWYYCESAEAYYPRVPSCAEPWLKVPPVPE